MNQRKIIRQAGRAARRMVLVEGCPSSWNVDHRGNTFNLGCVGGGQNPHQISFGGPAANPGRRRE